MHTYPLLHHTRPRVLSMGSVPCQGNTVPLYIYLLGPNLPFTARSPVGMGMLMGQCVLFQQVTGIIAHCDWHRSALLDDVIDDGFTLWGIVYFLIQHFVTVCVCLCLCTLHFYCE